MVKPMVLEIKATQSGGYEIWLDDKKLHHVKSYKIESSQLAGNAELTIKMSVKYPAVKEEGGKAD